MIVDPQQLWMLVIGATALASWWIAVRPGTTYRPVGASVSVLLVLLAVLVCALAITGQHTPARVTPVNVVMLS